jgi:uncharacterized protein YegP (UPF0339 family)
MAARYEVKVNAKKQYSFNLKAGNGEIILTSEMYQSKAAALNGIKSVQTNCGNDDAYEVRAAKNGESFFVIRAKNKEVIGRSELYKTAAGARRGIASVKRNGGTTEIKELA